MSAQDQKTAEKVATVLALYSAGSITLEAAAEALAVLTYGLKVHASRAADVALAATAGALPLGIVPDPDRHLERLTDSVRTVLIDAGDSGPEDRITRLLDSEAEVSRQKTQAAAIRSHGWSQYREIVLPDACEVCQPFTNKIHEASESFEPHHPRCRCEIEPYGERKVEISV